MLKYISRYVSEIYHLWRFCEMTSYIRCAHKLAFFVLFSLLVCTVSAQVPETVYAFPMGGATQNNIYVAIGVPFYEQVDVGEYNIALGVAQAQLVESSVEAENCDNEPYTEHYFDIGPLPAGVYTFENYQNSVDTLFNYDLRNRLLLTVWPTYEVTVHETYHGEYPVIDGHQIVDGLNELELKSVHDCDSMVHLYASLCPFTVQDADENLYNTLVLDRYCWTQTNLMTTRYADANRTPVMRALVYKSEQNPDEVANEATFGRLYTWYSAVNVEENSDAVPAVNAAGFVQGICPEGWHVPATPEIVALLSHPSEDIKSTTLWLEPAFNNNRTGFTLLPAGQYSASAQRFENLYTGTHLWKAVDPSSSDNYNSIYINYFCDEPTLEHALANNAYSVRCVKDYEY